MIFRLGNLGCINALKKGIFNCHTIKINQSTIVRSASSTSRNVYPDHELVYKFPLIRIASLINRLKLYQTFFTVVGIPAVITLTACEAISYEAALLYLSSGVTWCLPLYAIGYLGTNRVGFLHLKEDKKSVKISYANFWGKRIVIDVPIEDIWPIGDLPVANPLYYSLRRYSTKNTLKFNIKYGIIVDDDKFRIVFGEMVENVKS